MKKNIFVFIKSFVITAFSVVMIVALISGLIIADTGIRRTTGESTKDVIVYDKAADSVSVNLFGNSVSADLKPIRSTVNNAKSLAPLIPPEIRLINAAVVKLADMIEEKLW